MQQGYTEQELFYFDRKNLNHLVLKSVDLLMAVNNLLDLSRKIGNIIYSEYSKLFLYFGEYGLYLSLHTIKQGFLDLQQKKKSSNSEAHHCEKVSG